MASAISPLIRGTTLSVRKSRVVDGDTLKIYLPGRRQPESIRVLNVDTEESFSFSGSKPVTPLGKQAKSFATEFFASSKTVTIEFPDDTPLPQALDKHRGGFDRLLVYVWRESDGADFTESLIRNGYSPYSMKYGHSAYDSHKLRYIAAERAAQLNHLGVWNWMESNQGVEYNNYALFSAWWELRAQGVETYRKFNQHMHDSSLLHYVEDYSTIKKMAVDDHDVNTDDDVTNDTVVTIFANVTNLRIVNGLYAVSDIGSSNKPIRLYIPRVENLDDNEGDEEMGNINHKNNNNRVTKNNSKGKLIVDLLQSRYVDQGPTHPRRGYVFLSGRLRLFRGKPQLIVTDPHAIGDIPSTRPIPSYITPRPSRTTTSSDTTTAAAVGNDDDDDDIEDSNPPNIAMPSVRVRIFSVLPDPAGVDRHNEVVTLVGLSNNNDNGNVNGGGDSQPSIQLDGWTIKDMNNHSFHIPNGTVVSGDPQQKVNIRISSGSLMLNDNGDQVFLLNQLGQIVHQVQYSKSDVIVGTSVQFPLTD